MNTKKEECIKIMQELFGPASASVVRNMRESDEKIVRYCRQKVEALIGQDAGKRFDLLM